MKILKKWPAFCDFCGGAKPSLVFDLPVGTPLYLNKVDGMIVFSNGWLAACQACGEIIASGENAAHRTAVRFVDAHPEIYRPPAPRENTRESVRDWKQNANRILLKQIKNLAAPRPYVPFEDPLEGKLVEFTAEDLA